MTWINEVDEIKRREELAQEMGGAERVGRQRSFGRLTVRDRIDKLVDPGSFMTSMDGAIDFRQDVTVSLVKAVVFGALIGLIATYRGSISERSAAGVSDATTDTVVIASVVILVFDFFITGLWGI